MVEARNPTNTGILLVALAMLGEMPNEIKIGSVTAEPLLTTVFKNPPRKPAAINNANSKKLFIIQS